MKRGLINIIRIYQRTLSPDHGWRKQRYPHGYCRHYPTCSEYAIIAIENYGAGKGSAKAVWRIMQCNPFTRPRVDLSCYHKEVSHV